MATVKALMQRMEAQALEDTQFAQLLSAIADDPSSAALAAKSCANTRKFTAHQAAQVVRMVHEASPFDAVEVACVMHACMINREAFQLVLNEFADDADRDNILYRLKIRPDGEVVSTASTSGVG